MSHLPTERLAALVDEQPTADEHTHLAHCAVCARELEAQRSLFAIAGSEREAMQLPLTRWESLSRELRKEGLIAGGGTRDGGGESWLRFTRFPHSASRLPLQAAAALLLVAGGVVLGRATTSEPLLPGGLSGTATVSARSPDSLPGTFASVEDANRWKTAYADAYQRTVTFLAANDTTNSAETPAVMRARLSALNSVSRTTREALVDAPFDPVINDFYLNSFAQREATLRQLNAALPQGVRMKSF